MSKRILAGAIVGVIASHSSASTLLYEPFAYADSATFPQLGGHIDTNPTNPLNPQTWVRGQANASSIEPQLTDSNIANGGLTYPGLPTSLGASAFTSGVGNSNAGGVSRIPFGADLKSAYYSMIIQVPAATTAFGANGANGSFFSGLQYNPSSVSGGALNAAPSGAAAALCIRLHNGTTGATTFDLGVAYRDTAPRIFDTNGGAGYAAGSSIFLVVRYDSNDSAGTTDFNDAAALYINPSAATFGGADPNTPTVSSSSNGVIHDYFYDTNALQLESVVRSIFLRNNTSEPSAIQVDEIRVGNSFADVTSNVPVPEPTTLATLGLAGLGLLARRRRA